MRQVTVWLTAMAAIAILFLGWYISVPMKKGFEERFDERFNYTDNPMANSTYERLKTSTDYGQNLTLYLFTAIFLIWAFLNMTRRERYSGVYG